MRTQGYDRSGAQVVTEEEVNRRRAATERPRTLPLPRRARASDTPGLPVGEEDPRRALCSNAELLDAREDVDAVLDRYSAASPPEGDRPAILPEHAQAGVLDVDEVLDALERHHHAALPARSPSAGRLGTADFEASTPTTRRHRRGPGGFRLRRLSLSGWKAAVALAGVVAVVGLCGWAALSATVAHHSAAGGSRVSRVSAVLTAAGVAEARAAYAVWAAADRAVSPLERAGHRAGMSRVPRVRRHRAHARQRHSKQARGHAVAAPGRAAGVPSVSAPTVIRSHASTTAAPVQSAAPRQSSHPKASNDQSAFGAVGSLGPGHSPDS
jgi:hypothetical protein